MHHLDALFWKANWEGVPREEQRKVQKNLIKEEEWIIDGNYGGTMDLRLNRRIQLSFLIFIERFVFIVLLKELYNIEIKQDRIWVPDVKKD